MLTIKVTTAGQSQELELPSGILELGRGPQRELKRLVIKDEFVSRDHLQIEEVPNGRARVKNLSKSQEVRLPEGNKLAIGAAQEFALPLRMAIGNTLIEVKSGGAQDQEADEETQNFDKEMYLTIAQPMRRGRAEPAKGMLKALGDTPTPEKIAHWLESVIGLQRSPAGTKEFFEQTAKALVELVDLELGMVLLKRPTKWEIVGYHATSDKVNSRYSRTLLAHVIAEKRTFYQDADNMKIQAASLLNVEAVVVSPIFGMDEEVAGVMYGSRTWGGLGRGKIRPLEAQVVQLLAGAVGDNMTRTAATKTRVQFEQFFSTELVRELERDPKLLEGRSQEVTILVSDLRGFTALSERLEPETTCQVVRDIMERLTERIVGEGGVIVDYAGDGILAMWNAPVKQEDHVARACRAAILMLDELPGLNTKWLPTVGGPLALGIGINTGIAQVGNTGSTRKLKYGPHGMTVNLASRVQDATKKAGVSLLISKSVRERVGSQYTTRSVGAFELKGITEPVELFELSAGTPTLVPGSAQSFQEAGKVAAITK